MSSEVKILYTDGYWDKRVSSEDVEVVLVSEHEREVQRAIAAGIRMQDKCAALEAENARLTAQLAAIQGGMGEEVKRLHAMLDDWEADANLLEKERDTLRAELAEVKGSQDE